jgi:uncharacterized protein (TIRG00374 family)
VVSLAALWLALQSVDVRGSANQLAGSDPLPLIACLAVIAVQVTLRAFRWRLLLPSPRDGRQLKVRRIVPVLLVGYLGNTVLPARLGEVIRAYLVARREDLEVAGAFGSVVLERVLDTATLACMAFLAAVAIDAPTWIQQGTGIAALVAGGATIALVVVGPGPLVSAIHWLTTRLPGSSRLEPVALPLEAFVRGIGRPARSRAIVLAAGISAVCWIGDAAIFWLVARSIGVQIDPMAALVVAAVTVLGTALPSAPGYVGTFELAASATARALGVAATPALALAVLAHAMTVLVLAIGGAVSLVLMNTRLGQLAADAAGSRRAVRQADSQP